ncbi:Serine/threonine-protein phosphatase 6 regulatory ankyrin repeat subunit A, partial [Stegodyphus mimosarum]
MATVGEGRACDALPPTQPSSGVICDIVRENVNEDMDTSIAKDTSVDICEAPPPVQLGNDKSQLIVTFYELKQQYEEIQKQKRWMKQASTPLVSSSWIEPIDHSKATGVTAMIAVLQKGSYHSSNMAIENNPSIDLCMLLIERGCNLKATDKKRRTALHLAVIAHQERLVRKLLLCGIDVDETDNYGLTPLYYACKNENMIIVDLLIAFGANLRRYEWKIFLNSVKPELRREHPFSYVIRKSKHCFTLENLCCITIRNPEKDVMQLGLSPSLAKRLQLKV